MMYVEVEQFTLEERDLFLYCMHSMDQIYMDLHNED